MNKSTTRLNTIMFDTKKTFANLFPEISKEWDYEKNEGKTPSDFSCGSGFEAWWICSKCGSNYKMRILHRTNGHGCKICGHKRAVESSRKTILSKTESLMATYPELAKEFDLSNNNGLTPDKLSKGSNKNVVWKCSNGHSWSDTISHRVSGRGCPYCSNTKVLAGFNDLKTKNPDLAKEWHPTKNGDLKPEQVLFKATLKVFWLCPKCNHVFFSSINERNKGYGCPYCSGHKIDPDFNSFGALHPKLLKEWDYDKNLVSPFSISQSTRQKFYWICPHGHSYLASAHSRHSGFGCPICSQEKQTSFPEQCILFYLSRIFEVKSRYKLDGHEIDIYIPSLKIGIEYDGIRYHSSDKSIEKEKKKNKFLNEKGIRLIRIKEIEPRKTSYVNGDVIFYSYLPPSYKNIDVAIKYLSELMQLDNEPFVDIVRDTPLIQEQYRKIEMENSIIAKHPEFLKEWDFEKNGGLNPKYVGYSSSKEYFWKCKNGHSYHASPTHRMRGNGCPYCSGHKVWTGFNDIQTTHPDVARHWHPSLNTKYKPSEVSAGSEKEAWWICDKGHIYRRKVCNEIKSNSNCPYCRGRIK